MSAISGMPAIAARSIAAGKSKSNVFSDLSFEIAPASFTALVGANGSGKTTLFETLLGLVRVRTGSISVLGQSPRAARRQVAYVAQANQLMHDGQFVGREFVAAAYKGHRWGVTWRGRDASCAVDRALVRVGAMGLADRKLSELSGGQRQRLLIAQALVNEPRLVFMDEPLGHLDPAAQDQVVALAAHLRDALGIAVLFSTHDVNPVVDAADQVLYLAGGQGRIGPVDEVVTDSVLSVLYGVPMHVVRERGALFVMRDQIQSSAERAKSPASRRLRA